MVLHDILDKETENVREVLTILFFADQENIVIMKMMYNVPQSSAFIDVCYKLGRSRPCKLITYCFSSQKKCLVIILNCLFSILWTSFYFLTDRRHDMHLNCTCLWAFNKFFHSRQWFTYRNTPFGDVLKSHLWTWRVEIRWLHFHMYRHAEVRSMIKVILGHSKALLSFSSKP